MVSHPPAAREGTGTSDIRFAQEPGWPQPRISRIETGTTFPSEEHETVAKFQPVIIPSQLRTMGHAAEYLRLPLGPMAWGQDEAGITAMVAAQMQRQNILYEPGRLFRIVILEAALSTRLVSPAAMAGQRHVSMRQENAVTVGVSSQTRIRDRLW